MVNYKPVALFSLRTSQATSSGGKTLLVPTPYAYKMALVDAAFRISGREKAVIVFDSIKGRDIRFRPPSKAIVSQTFVKLLRQARENKDSDDSLSEGPYQRTIAYREYCFFDGNLSVAIDIDGLSNERVQELTLTTAHINYLGKRGGFFQFVDSIVEKEIPDHFTLPAGAMAEDLSGYGMSQFLDDLGSMDEEDLFKRIDVYSGKGVILNRHRVLVHHLLPYSFAQSSKGYTVYAGPANF
ncbi:hypothetical protein SY88_13190 [Clostridiales bacterium PH28_bin88]|nr:hypothetical protein SY88_13190 [Clostridiales bacterium PH28_bin88]